MAFIYVTSALIALHGRRFSVRYSFCMARSIAITDSVRNIHACLSTCDDACGYVQYAVNGTCVLYSEALLLTEPATKTGQKVGYRKVILHNFILRYCYD